MLTNWNRVNQSNLSYLILINCSTLSASDAAPVKKPAVWSLDSDDIRDAEVDLLDPDSLLDETDYVKPDPLSLKYDCGTNKAGKKKACKNCVCGLAEELEAGK